MWIKLRSVHENFIENNLIWKQSNESGGMCNPDGFLELSWSGFEKIKLYYGLIDRNNQVFL